MKRFNWKKILSLVLVLTLVVGTLTWNKKAASAEGDSTAHPTKVETETKDHIKITKELKNLQVLGGDDAGFAEAQIELTVNGADATISQPTTAKTAIVFVMDLSNSMSYDKDGNEKRDGKAIPAAEQRITVAKAAAISFAEGVLTEENKNAVSIGIASFARDGHENLSLSNSLKAVKDAIGKLAVKAGETGDYAGGTNLQAGIQKAEKILATSDASNKIIVILSDGQPTFSYQATAVAVEATTLNDESSVRLLSSFNSTRKGDGSKYTFSEYTVKTEFPKNGWYTETDFANAKDANKVYVSLAANSNKVSSSPEENEVGYFKNKKSDTTGTKVIYHTKRTGDDVKVDNNGLPAISEAKKSGAIIYSIAYDVENNLNSEVDKTKTDAEHAKYVMYNIASSKAKYFAATSGETTNTEQAISSVIASITTSVNQIVAAAKGTSLQDTFPSYMTAVSVSGADAKDATISNANTYGNDIEWSLADLKEIDTKKITVNVRIDLNKMAEAYAASHSEYADATAVKKALAEGTELWFNMNQQVILSYKDKEGKPVEDKSIGVVEGAVKVPQGQVAAYKYTINYVDEDGNAAGTSVSGSKFFGEKVTIGESDVFAADAKAETKVYDHSKAPVVTVTTNNATVTNRQFNMPTSEVVITVQYTHKLYKIYFTDEDGKTIIKVNDNDEKDYREYRSGATVTKPADPTKSDSPEYKYTFSGWDPQVTVVTGDQTYKATYSETKRKYTIKFLSEDQKTTLIPDQILEWGDEVAQPSADKVPAKDPTPGESFNWSGTWKRVDEGKPEDFKAECDGDATYIPVYTSTVRSYPVTFHYTYNNDEGEIVTGVYGTPQDYKYNTTPTAPSTNPSSYQDWEYTYSFTGWTPEFTPVTGEQHYYAQYNDKVKREYTVDFIVDGVGNPITYKAGAPITNRPENPSKASGDTYDYDFVGWKLKDTADTQILEEVAIDKTATRDVTYVAVFSERYIDYTVKFVNHNGQELQKFEKLHWDATEPVKYTKEVPSKVGDEVDTLTYIHNFIGFDNGWGGVDTTKAVSQISFNTDHTVVFTAQFDDVYIDYEVAFVDEDGKTPIKVNGNDVNLYHYGQKIVLPADPEKTDSTEWDYSFGGWTPQVPETCEGKATYQATYTQVKQKYTITFQNFDGTQINSLEYEYGVMPTIPTPTKYQENDATYTYEFTGWDKKVVAVVGDATYKAKSEGTLREYTVIFVDEDGKTELQKIENLHYLDDVVVNYTNGTPSKENSPEFSYTFMGFDNGWDNTDNSMSIKDITFDGLVATFKATYSAKTNKYNVTFVFNNGETDDLTTKYDYNTVLSRNDVPEANKADDVDDNDTPICYWTFDHWYMMVDGKEVEIDPAGYTVKADVKFFAAYTETRYQYQVSFTIIYPEKYDIPEGYYITGSSMYKYGESIDIPSFGENAKERRIKYKDIWYVLETVWTPEIDDKCHGEAAYTIGYKIDLKEAYTVTFDFDNGDDDFVREYKYHDPIVVPDSDKIVKESDKEWHYLFSHWTPAFETITDENGKEIPVCPGNKVYKAIYSKQNVKYEVSFIDEDGNPVKVDDQATVKYNYQEKIAVPASPEKDKDDVYTYEIPALIADRWTGVRAVDNTPVSFSAICVESVVYSPVYEPVYRDYWIVFEDLEDANEKDEVLSLPYHYGDTFVVPESDERVKAHDDKFDYTFIGWAVKSENEEATYSEADVVLKPVEEGNAAENLKVVRNVTYVAVYKPSLRVFNVEFLNDDETTLGNGFKSDVVYGNKVTEENYDAATNAAEGVAILRAHEDKEYFFAGWEIKNEDGVKVPVSAADYVITADTTFYASYVLKQDYMIFYHGADPSKYGAENEEKDYMFTKASVKEGSDYILITYGPSLAETNTTKFEFIGWRTEYVAPYVFPDATQLDIREARVNVVTISRLAAPTFTTKYVKNELDCVVEIKTVANKVDLYPVYNSIEKKFTVTFKDADGTVLATRDDFIYNEDATTLKPANPQGWTSVSGYTTTTYTFKNWDVSDDVLKAVQKDMVVTAQYDVKSETNIPFNIITPTPSPSPTPSPTPTVTPTPVEEEIIETPETPQGPVEEPEEEIIPPQPETPQGAPEEEVDLDDIETPQGDLPKTGTTPTAVFFGLGAACIMLGGVMLKGNRRREDEM